MSKSLKLSDYKDNRWWTQYSLCSHCKDYFLMLALQWPNDHVIYYPPRKANAAQCLTRYFVQYIGVEYIPQVAANVQLAKILAQAQGNVNRQWIDDLLTARSKRG
jgi:hypothetical protein